MSWTLESFRHALARKGIKTKAKKPDIRKKLPYMERHAPAIMGISGAYGGMFAAGTLMPPLGIPLGYIGGGIGGLATGKVMQKFVFEKEAREKEKQKRRKIQVGTGALA